MPVIKSSLKNSFLTFPSKGITKMKSIVEYKFVLDIVTCGLGPKAWLLGNITDEDP